MNAKKKNNLLCRFSLCLPLQLEQISTAAILGRTFCERQSLLQNPPDLARNVELVTSEACTNAVKHGGREGLDAVFVVTYELFPDRLVIQVEDPGPDFDPEEVPDPDFEDHQVGGYGLFIIKASMDDVSYHRSGDHNFLTMTKYLKPCEE
jgi:anti-sigma regulatory factor (Ser/Thr protein kinase)